MLEKRNKNIVYRLEGRSLEAALRLEAEVVKEIEAVRPKCEGNGAEIRDSWQKMARDFFARFEKEAPDLLFMTGLKSPSLQVFESTQSLPRAYEEYPMIFSAGTSTNYYYMYAPVDYHGGHFIPPDAVLLNEEEERQAGNLLFAGGFLGNAPIFERVRTGVALPADYLAPFVEKEEEPLYLWAYFLPVGRSLEIVQDYNAREKDFQSKMDIFTGVVKAEILARKEQTLQKLPAGEDIYVNVSYRRVVGEKPALSISVRREGKIGVMAGGQPVDPPDSPAFYLQPGNYSEYFVIPRTDTPEGKKMSALFDAVPATPGLTDYLELVFKNDVPQLIETQGLTVLRYSVDIESKKLDFCPPGAKPIPAAVFEWLRADDADRAMGIIPPPMPQDVAEVLSAVAASKPEKKKSTAPAPRR